jgi:hypothetical protein
MLNAFQDQASGLRRLMESDGESTTAVSQNLEALLNLVDGMGFAELMRRLERNGIPFLDLTQASVMKVPLDIVSEEKLVMYINQSSASIKEAYGIIKHLANTTIPHEIGLLICTQSQSLAETIYRNLTRASENFRRVSLIKLGYLGQGNTYIETFSGDNSLVSQ